MTIRITIDAIRWTGRNNKDVMTFLGDKRWENPEPDVLTIRTPTGDRAAFKGNWIIMDNEGRFHISTDEDFERRYAELVSDSSNEP
jgi:hypothetical protein